MKTLNFSFDNQFLKHFPADEIAENYPRQVSQAYSWVTPKKTAAPKLIALTEALALEVGFNVDENIALFTDVFSGNALLDGMQPYAMNYGGHQFGHWAGQLGDGRAINLGQITTDSGLLTLQLKGAGPTPYSRTADGLAVLRSSIREFLCSEAMYHLGIPTTRALSLCLTGDDVIRDMFYNGNIKAEPGAVVCRVSKSFLRFGCFQLPANRGDKQLLKQLVDYSINQDFPHLGQPCKSVYLKWFQEICERTCQLIVHWMRVGFVHGVMNTDNLSIIGETIDYGPYGWIDNFDLHWTPNTTDAQGKRYCFGAQAEIGQWNLFQLANAIYPLIEDAAPLNETLNNYATSYHQAYGEMMASKLGLERYIKDKDDALFIELEQLMTALTLDMTIFYRLLATATRENSSDVLQFFTPCFYESEDFTDEDVTKLTQWLTLYFERLTMNECDDEQRRINMNLVNPKYVLRNYIAQQAIEQAEQGDYQLLNTLQTVFKKPYDEQPEFEQFAMKRPQWAKNKAGCSMLSCSS
ncbi:protein adenylyltransferase SelO [Thalassotalea piscium]